MPANLRGLGLGTQLSDAILFSHTQLSWGQYSLSSRSAPPTPITFMCVNLTCIITQPSARHLGCNYRQTSSTGTPLQNKENDPSPKKKSLRSFIGARFLTYTVMYLLNRVLCRNYTLSIQTGFGYTLPIDGVVPFIKFYTSESFEFDQAVH